MNAIALLLGLLGLAYFGSIAMAGRTIRGYGLPSGSEYLVVGLVVGPDVLGVIDRSTTRIFEPVLIVGLGWLAAIIGIDYGAVEERRVSFKGAAWGIVLAALSAAGIGAALYFAGRRWLAVSPKELLLSAAGGALVACETTRHAVRWVAERYGASGRFSELLDDIADADDAVPLVALAILVPFGATPDLEIAIPWWGWSLVTLGVGIALGSMVALLLRSEESTHGAWLFLLGAALLAVGSTWRLGLSVLSSLFLMGLTLAVLSRHREALRRSLNATEHAVLPPILLLAGTLVDVRYAPGILPMVAVALAARFVVKLCTGTLAATAVGIRRGGRASFGLGTLSAGALTMSVGLFCALRFPGQVGSVILATAAATTLFGELVGPVSLRRTLAHAGEIRKERQALAESP